MSVVKAIVDSMSSVENKYGAEVLEGLPAKVRNGLFHAASRTYGEQYVEPFIRFKYGFQESDGQDYVAVNVPERALKELKTF